MPEINDRFQFEPDKNARHAWLATRKRSMTCGNQSLPGFYQTVDYTKDFGWVMLAVGVEAAAIALTLYGGILKSGVYLIGALIVIPFFIILDIVGATFVHRDTAKKCIINSRILITKDIGEKQGLRNVLKQGKAIKFFGVFFIILSCLLKIAAILLLGKFNLTFYVVMTLLYFIVIYIHIAHTGFYLAELRVNNMFKEQHDMWAEDKMLSKQNKKEEDNIRFSVRRPSPTSILESEIKLNIENKVSVGEHSITFLKVDQINNKSCFIYQIETNGILKDDDINLLTNSQTDIQAGIIALACLKHQVEKVHP